MERGAAEENVAAKFTRTMNATPSPWGILSDVAVAGAAAGMVVLLGLLAAPRAHNPIPVLEVSLSLSLVPFVVSTVAGVILTRRTRARVVDWMTALPFDVVNLNALLAGLGDTLEIVFAGPAPSLPRAELQKLLDAVSEETIVTDLRPEQRLFIVRLGVIDSKRVPSRTNHARWLRLCTTVERVLVPMHATHPIERILVV